MSKIACHLSALWIDLNPCLSTNMAFGVASRQIEVAAVPILQGLMDGALSAFDFRPDETQTYLLLSNTVWYYR
jgi:hypothetical protein